MFMPVEADGLPYFWTPMMSGVGLAPNATVRVDLRTSHPCPDAFVVLFSEPQLQMCAPLLVHRGPKPSTYLPCSWRASLAGPVNASHLVQASSTARYFLGVVQAVPGAVQGLGGEVGFVNPGGSQLPVQQRSTPRVVNTMAWAFLGSALALLVLLAVRRRGRSRLHGLLLLALMTKCLVLVLIQNDIKALARAGRQSLDRQVLWQLLRQIQLILEVLVFYVIGLGWKVMRSHLRPSEWAFAGVVGSISFFLGTFEVACNTFAACGSQSYLLTQFTLHSLCFLVVIIATNFNIFTLQRQIAEALAAPETSTLYAKQRAYCWFRGFFLYFVIVPTVTNFLALHVVRWDELWVIVLVREGSLWAIYTAVLWLFRPGLSHLRVFELAVVESSDSESSDSHEIGISHM